MSTLTASWVRIEELYVCAQIRYDHRDYIVLEVLEQPIGGWVVIANAVHDDATAPARPRRWPLVFGSRYALVELEHRSVGVSR